jgi:hypothetical protein
MASAVADSSGDVPCFFCRFNLGFSLSSLEPGLAGFVVVLSSLFCLCLCGGLALCWCCCGARGADTKHGEYVELPVRDESAGGIGGAVDSSNNNNNKPKDSSSTSSTSSKK